MKHLVDTKRTYQTFKGSLKELHMYIFQTPGGPNVHPSLLLNLNFFNLPKLMDK